jgi:hypothetical protein
MLGLHNNSANSDNVTWTAWAKDKAPGIYEVYECDGSVYRFCAFVDNNNTQVATIAAATTVKTVCVFQPVCTSACR